jgi:hypothetical protein
MFMSRVAQAPRRARCGSLLLAALAAALPFAVLPEPALAQKKKRSEPAKAEQSEKLVAPVGPLTAVISIGSQKVTVFSKDGVVARSAVSTGRSGYETPQGVFSILEKKREHFSNLYDDAPMPNMQRITWSGVAMHAGNLPGYPASHGCIRLPHGFSDRLFGLTRVGMRVIVAKSDVAPADISHPRLFVPSAPAPIPVAAAPPASDAGGDGETARATSKGDVSQAPMMLGIRPVALGQLAAPQSRPSLATKTAIAADAAKVAALAQRAADEAKSISSARLREAQRAAATLRTIERTKLRLEQQVARATQALETARTPQQQARIETAKGAAASRLEPLAQEHELAKAAEAAKQAEAATALEAARAAESARAAAARAAAEAQRATQPVSVFVSRRAGRLYVRQGNVPLFDVPIAIADPHRPIGTHVFTAVEASESAGTARWQAITAAGGSAGDFKGLPEGRYTASPAAPVSGRPGAAAAAALDRIEIPPETRQRIAEMLSTGSSLIVSDYPVSHETGKGTDFIVLTQ